MQECPNLIIREGPLCEIPKGIARRFFTSSRAYSVEPAVYLRLRHEKKPAVREKKNRVSGDAIPEIKKGTIRALLILCKSSVRSPE